VEQPLDGTDRVLKVRTRALSGRPKAVRQRVAEPGIGRQAVTSHQERLNGTLRGQRGRSTHRTRQVSPGMSLREWWLPWSIRPW
jgi:hypothetical protein